ncbi:hypothetical protein Spla01_02360 [Streptomyces platensis]|uniref:Uncharacterized protein n=1 Tax=Streptomyces platensis TaxID=58346 RepID=A0ABX3XML9_STRPT|nr:hypothetical protein BG653_07081 [Streptomyces platensis]
MNFLMPSGGSSGLKPGGKVYSAVHSGVADASTPALCSLVGIQEQCHTYPHYTEWPTSGCSVPSNTFRLTERPDGPERRGHRPYWRRWRSARGPW